MGSGSLLPTEPSRGSSSWSCPTSPTAAERWPNGAYETIRDIPAGGELVTPLLPGFRLDVATLFVP